MDRWAGMVVSTSPGGQATYMSAPACRVLVSDLGQVLLPFDFSPVKLWLADHSRYLGRPDEAWAAAHAVYERLGFSSGRCEPEDFLAQLRIELGLQAGSDEFAKGWSDAFWTDQRTIDLVAGARVSSRVLLSNTDPIHWQWIVANYGEHLEMFDHLVPSHQSRALKPHAEAYEYVERLTGLPANAHLLIDDLLENVAGARASGWDAILHTTAEALVPELEGRGLQS